MLVPKFPLTRFRIEKEKKEETNHQDAHTHVTKNEKRANNAPARNNV